MLETIELGAGHNPTPEENYDKCYEIEFNCNCILKANIYAKDISEAKLLTLLKNWENVDLNDVLEVNEILKIEEEN